MNKFIITAITASLTLALSACGDGDNGKNGVNGANGSNGVDGLTSLIKQTELPVGDENCLNSGVRIDSGIDANSDGVLEESEFSESQFVCAPTINEVGSADIATNSYNSWFVAGASEIATAEAIWQEVTEQVNATAPATKVAFAKTTADIESLRGTAKNVILFVGDGMGVSTVTAARILDGQSKGLMGEENQLSFDKFPFSGFAKTYNVDAQTPDSAGTMTAMMSGIKTDVGVIGVDEDIAYGDCSTVAGNEMITVLELAEIAGKSTGIISTARITHATPAATFAKSANRNWEDVSDMPQSAIDGGCEDIASQLVNFEANLEARYTGTNVNGIEVVMGGGRRHFLPKDAAFNSADAVSGVEGDRTDGRDLITEWKTAYPNGSYIWNEDSFNAIDPATTERIFGLFNESHMQYEADRENDIAGEPSLAEMTAKAIGVLENNEKGFFLTVESGRIDHAHHAGNAYNALNDAIEFSKAVQVAVDATDDEDTLIIVTADHSHVFTIAGYPKRGNPILGKVVGIGSEEPSLASDGMPYTTLGYTNGLGYRDLGDETNADASYMEAAVTGRVDLTNVETQTPGFHQEALVPLSSETHAGEDVAVYAMGPGAHLVTGTNEQSLIFHIMDFAADLSNENSMN
ncbi:alkaline phosphatase [Thalassotalea castellviae]|uniref:Alkaline phosphatase n=1 Tax=Thalassotalea castellviae TaxID=3075612 RepID=A0ABU3A281_9GAMM|nr:alkaline phosphatase [Thalassotalea sp. W431]MDT0604285.1 alkaline phosphatase [Thalassotalea sp. W431]